MNSSDLKERQESTLLAREEYSGLGGPMYALFYCHGASNTGHVSYHESKEDALRAAEGLDGECSGISIVQWYSFEE